MRIKLFIWALPAILFFAGIARAQNKAIDSLRKIVALAKNDSLEVSAYVNLANEFARVNIATAKQYGLQAIALGRKINSPKRLSAAYSITATLFVQINKTDSARYCLDQLKKLADDTHIGYVMSTYNLSEGLFYRKKGNYKASIPYMKEALRLFTIQKDKLSMAGQNLNIGNNYLDMGDYRNAMAFHLAALKLFEVMGNRRGISFCYQEIANDFIKLNQFSAAMPYALHSIEIKMSLNDNRGMASAYMAVGEIKQNLHNPTEALKNYKAALAINKELKLPIDEAATELAIGKFYAEEKDWNNAREYFDNSAAIFTQLRDTAHLSIVNAEKANLQTNLLHQQKTEKTFLNTLGTALKMGDKSTEINNYKHLSDFYAKNKQYDLALAYSEKYHNVSDSIKSQSLKLQVNEMEQRYNLEKKEKELTVLRKDKLLYQANLSRQKVLWYGAAIVFVMLLIIGFLVLARSAAVQKASRMLEMEQMRNSIARNLHDDIGSTLSSINILSQVALRRVNGNVTATRDLEKIADSSFTIMESMSDIVWAINPANDSLGKTIFKMKDFAASILEPAGIRFEFSGENKLSDIKLGVDERKDLYLIFKETINNIAKYSAATLVTIKFQKNAARFLMAIEDNGKGFDPLTQHSGNGLRNMQSRANQMRATFGITTAPGAGTRITLALPVPSYGYITTDKR